jgi:hypothetical protein
MLMKDDQKGFGAVEGTIILFVVGLISFSGWYVYHHRKTGDAIYRSAANAGAVVTAPTKSNTTTKEVKISEFGVKLTVPVTLKSLIYKIMTVDYSGSGINTLGSYPTAFFSTKELDSAENGSCSLKSATERSIAPLGYLTRATGQYSTDVSPPPGAIVKYPADSASNPTGTLIKQFPDFYLAFRSPDHGCFDHSANNDNASELSGQLSAALKSVTLVK